MAGRTGIAQPPEPASPPSTSLQPQPPHSPQPPHPLPRVIPGAAASPPLARPEPARRPTRDPHPPLCLASADFLITFRRLLPNFWKIFLHKIIQFLLMGYALGGAVFFALAGASSRARSIRQIGHGG